MLCVELHTSMYPPGMSQGLDQKELQLQKDMTGKRTVSLQFTAYQAVQSLRNWLISTASVQ